MSTITESSTWSATINQIESGELLEGGAGNLLNQAAKQLTDRTLFLRDRLNDASSANDKIWSADKINSEITSHTSTANIHRVLNDGATTSTNLWSASKIQSELNNVNTVVSIHSSAFTVVGINQFIFADTSGGAWNLTLPIAPSLGDIVFVVDMAFTWDVNTLTILRNGQKIDGVSDDLVCDVKGCHIKLVYSNVTYGWKLC